MRERAFAGGGAGFGFQQGCRVVRLAAGGYLEVWVYQASGAAVSFATNAYWNWMTVAKMPSTASLGNATVFSAATATFTKVPYTSPLYDDQSQVNGAQSRFMAAASGDYQFCASLTSAPGDVTHNFELDLYINGTRERALAGGGGLLGFAHGCRVVRLVAGNYVETWAYQASGAAISFPADAIWDWMTVSQVR